MNTASAGIGASIVRTFVPILVGAIVTGFSRVGIDLGEDPETIVAITSAITLVVSTLYYALVRLLESKVGPAWGWLLGYANAPRYDAIDTTGFEKG